MRLTDYKIINKRKRNLVWFADKILDTAAWVSFKRRPTSPLAIDKNAIKKILIVRLAYIGDVIMTFPVIDALANAFPNAKIDFLTSSSAAPLLQNYPSLDEIIEFDAPWFYPRSKSKGETADLVRTLTAKHYDLGIDFRGDIRNIYHCLYRPGIPIRVSYTSGGGGALLTHPIRWELLQHKVDYHLDILRKIGIPAPRTNPKIFLTETEKAEARKILAEIPGCRQRAPALVHPGARLALKRWPIDRFISLIDMIQKNGLGPVVLLDVAGSEASRKIVAGASVAGDLTGRLTIRQMAAVMAQGRFLVCHDSGPMHIAAAVVARVVALFGPSLPVVTAPCGDGHIIIEAPCNMKDYCDENFCLHSEKDCMEKITVEQVFQKIQQLTE